MLASLIFIGVASDRATTFVDIDVDMADPAQRARDLLAEHRSCDQIEVWRDDHCIGVVARDALDQPL